ncbi:hypothetical protein SDC9_192954 [bioreactor metagenome]|uniref:Uncharacterized protein n=1 Tax=bioreactor metagenome TaxID=1076179 RepID=A0A645I261_9ZZZZ
MIGSDPTNLSFVDCNESSRKKSSGAVGRIYIRLGDGQERCGVIQFFFNACFTADMDESMNA